jgi:hypothetical protein
LRGVDRGVAAAIWDELCVYYVASLTPSPDDSMSLVLDIDTEEFESILERLVDRLGLAMPTAADPEEVPPIATILDLALYLNAKVAAAEGPTARNNSASGEAVR